MSRRIELFQGHKQPKCCARTAVWHRIHSRTFKLGESVEVVSSGMSFGSGVVTGNSGKNASCGDMRNRFLIQVTYDNGSKYHCLPCEVWRTSHRDSRSAVTQQQQQQQQHGISVTAVAMSGEQHTISALTEDTCGGSPPKSGQASRAVLLVACETLTIWGSESGKLVGRCADPSRSRCCEGFIRGLPRQAERQGSVAVVHGMFAASAEKW